MKHLSHATRTTCAYCGVGCGVIAMPLALPKALAPDVVDSRSFAISGDPDHPANFGRLCSKGSALADTIGTEGRLLEPRIGGREASWDEALDTVAARFRDTIAKHGPDSVAFYVSGQLLTEDYYVANKLMKGFLGSANIDTNSRLCMSSAVVAHQRAFGEDVVPGCYEDLELCDLLVLVGSNAAWCHPVLWRRIEEARRRRPSMKIVVVDPRRTPTCDLADLHLGLRSGTDVVLFDGLLAHLAREGFADERFVAEHTTGADNAISVARMATGNVSLIAARCGLAAADVEAFYRLFAKTERVVTAFSQGVNQSSCGSDKASSILNCHLLTGRIGKPGSGPMSLTGQPNAMGGREVGGLASTLAAHMSIDHESHRRIVQDFWKSPSIASKPGLKAVDLFEAVGDGRIKALWIIATNPAVSMPDADRVRSAIAGCDFVVVSDCIEGTDTGALAHVLLPAAGWGEKDGTITNSERRISRQRSFLATPGNAKPDWWIVSQVASRMGFGASFDYASPHAIFDEHARLSAASNGGTRVFDIGGLAGLTSAEYDALDPVCWPVPVRGSGGTARLFGDGGFAYAGGKAKLVPTAPEPPRHAVSAEFPFVLNTGRIRDQWHTMTRTGLSPHLAEHLPEPFVDMHIDDAAQAGIGDDDLVRVSTEWGATVMRARMSGETARGCLFVPIHWSAATSSDGRVGALTSPAVDPRSGEPEFKHTPAAIERVGVAWHGVAWGRDALAMPASAWWTRITGEHATRFEMAGVEAAADWAEWGRGVLAKASSDPEHIEYVDSGAGSYRLAEIKDGRLDACVFVARSRSALPSRAWIASLFERSSLGDMDRLSLMAGRPLNGDVDSSPLVCSCFGVRRRAIQCAIQDEGLQTTAQIGTCLRAGTNCGSCLPELRALLAAVPKSSAAA